MDVKFCPDCETYLVLEISNDENPNKLSSYKCKNCSYKKIVDISKEILAFKNLIISDFNEVMDKRINDLLVNLKI